MSGHSLSTMDAEAAEAAEVFKRLLQCWRNRRDRDSMESDASTPRHETRTSSSSFQTPEYGSAFSSMLEAGAESLDDIVPLRYRGLQDPPGAHGALREMVFDQPAEQLSGSQRFVGLASGSTLPQLPAGVVPTVHKAASASPDMAAGPSSWAAPPKETQSPSSLLERQHATAVSTPTVDKPAAVKIEKGVHGAVPDVAAHAATDHLCLAASLQEPECSTTAMPTPTRQELPLPECLPPPSSGVSSPLRETHTCRAQSKEERSPPSEDRPEPCRGSAKERPLPAAGAAGQLPRWRGGGQVVAGWEIVAEDVSLISEFEQLNESLVRHGFPSVPHKLEALPGQSPNRAILKMDVCAMWSVCSVILKAYDDRGKRVRDVVLAQRAEERNSRDARVQELLQRNKQLQDEVKALRSNASAQSTPTLREAPSPSKSDRGHDRDHGGDLVQMAARLKTAEATARQREHELERLRARLDNLHQEDSRRRQKEEAVLSQLERGSRGGGDERHGRDVALASKSRICGLQAENACLTRKVRDLTFQLEEYEHRGHLTGEKCDVGFPSAASNQESFSDGMHKRLDELLSQHEADQAVIRSLTQRLEAACSAPQQAELQWRREALRLREDLAHLRRMWRNIDPRELMRRDKDIKRLGLADTLEEGMTKPELVNMLLEACRLMSVCQVSQILPTLQSLCEIAQHQKGIKEFVEGVIGALQELDGGPSMLEGQQLDPEEALARLQGLCAAAAGRRPAEAAELREALAARLGAPLGASLDDISSRVQELLDKEDILCSISAWLRCWSPDEMPRRVEALMRICDERMASQRIVDALRDLLHVEDISEVLPALKGVLDVTAVRRLGQRGGLNGRMPTESEAADLGPDIDTCS